MGHRCNPPEAEFAGKSRLEIKVVTEVIIIACRGPQFVKDVFNRDFFDEEADRRRTGDRVDGANGPLAGRIGQTGLAAAAAKEQRARDREQYQGSIHYFCLFSKP